MQKASIVLATVNARYTHTAFGLRWLHANMGVLRDKTVVREFALGQPPLEIVESVLAHHPRVIGLGVYIWNVAVLTQVAQAIKAIRPDLTLVVGGPEISYEYETAPLFGTADYLIRGEAEHAFAALAARVLNGERPSEKVITPELPDLDALHLPYDGYAPDDIAQRMIYVETSRGCPFRCEFCLSSIDPCVREFALEPVLRAMARLIERGARRFTFVDRTFNLREARVEAVLSFFLDHWQDGIQLHFEILPDRLTEAMIQLFGRFPAGALYLETGVQTLDPQVQEAVSRRQDVQATLRTIARLRADTGAILHIDLVAGLPGETWQSFKAGFDAVIELRPHVIQLGILKRLKGAPIRRHETAGRLVFALHPPYEILQTDTLSFQEMQRIKRLARYLDLYYNSGNFPRTLPILHRARPSAFDAYMALSDALWAGTGRTHEFSLSELARWLYRFLRDSEVEDPGVIASTIEDDYHRFPGRRDRLRLHDRTG